MYKKLFDTQIKLSSVDAIEEPVVKNAKVSVNIVINGYYATFYKRFYLEDYDDSVTEFNAAKDKALHEIKEFIKAVINQ